MGAAVPGVVSAPRMAMSASTPPTSTGTPISAASSEAIRSIWRRSVLTITAMPTAASMENSLAMPPATCCGTRVSTASRSVMRMSRVCWLVSCAMVTRTFSIMPPTLVPASPVMSERLRIREATSMISAAPRSTSTSRVLVPWNVRRPAGMRRSCTSPSGVLMTTAERLPTRDRASGTTERVASASRPKRVAMPNGLDRVSTMRPTSATSMAASIPSGTFSIRRTSSTMGILRASRLWTSTPSSACRIAPVTSRRSATEFSRAATWS